MEGNISTPGSSTFVKLLQLKSFSFLRLLIVFFFQTFGFDQSFLNYLGKWFTVERNGVKFMGYLNLTFSVQGHFGVILVHLQFFRKDDFQNTTPSTVMIMVMGIPCDSPHKPYNLEF